MSQEQTLKRKAVHGILWKMADVGTSQIMSFVISVILARLIMPDQYGMIAMLGVFIAISSILIDSGFTSALMRKTDRTQADCSTVFWFNIVVSTGCYVILFFCAPLISEFYEMPQLTLILRVSALGLIIGAFKGVHNTLLRAELKFNLMTKINIIVVLAAGIIGIVMAYLDFQVWALVAQTLAGNIFSCIVVWHVVKWRPTMEFSRKSFKEFFGYGSKLLGSSLLDGGYQNMYSIVIGKVFHAADLAFYGRATTLANLTAQTPTSVLQSVTFPTLCKLQDNDEILKNAYRRMLRLSAFIVFPLCLGVGAVAFPLINVVFTDRWIYAASLLSIVVFGKMWWPIHAINLNYLMVKGKSNLFLKLEIIKKIQAVIVLCITLPFGLEAMCLGSVISSMISLFWNSYYNGKFLDMGILKQLRDYAPALILGLVMFAGARSTAHFLGNGIASLASSIAVGAAIYIGGALLFRFPEVKELKNLRK